MEKAYLSLGSNLGDRADHLRKARLAISEAFSGVRFSPVYETEPVDLLEQPWFLNQVVELQTAMEPTLLLEWVLRLEAELGRKREVPKGPRTLDVDILLYANRVLMDKNLKVPHPAILNRRHVLVPLCDLVLELRIPGVGCTVAEALKTTVDRSLVKPYLEVETI